MIVKVKPKKKPAAAKPEPKGNGVLEHKRLSVVKEPVAAGARGRPSGPRDHELESVLSEVTAAPQTQHVEEWVSVSCPYCGEDFEVHVTSEEDGQTLYEDCEVCCRPVSLHVQHEDGELQVEAYRS